MARSPGTLFRPTALARIRSPEQLDALLPLTAPLGWLALLILGLAFIVAAVWGFVGTVPRIVSGQGVIMRDTNFGIVEVACQGTGAVSEVMVQTGDIVTVGQVIARLDLAEVREQLSGSQKALKNLQTRHEEQTQIEAANLKVIEERLISKKGRAGEADVAGARNTIYEMQARAEQRRQQILEQETLVREIEARYEREGLVRVAHGGRVLEVVVSAGNFVEPGRTIVRLESVDGEYETAVYVPVTEGKKIKEGMVARVSPSIVRPEEYGYILGKVGWVSSYPVTREYLRNELGGNEQLVEKLLHGGSAIELVVKLESNSSDAGGFKWSSAHGPGVKIGSGTVCKVSVVIERVRPVDLIFPALRKQFGAY